ncbi:MAG: hypothetical protein PHQ96_09610 [Candidatus Omnitrophica bacterium]|nr:hypothetical protein [Candidatus Omnitrophota bacterium]
MIKTLPHAIEFFDKIKFILPAVALSVLVHLFFISTFSVYIDTKGSPVIYAWLDIVDKNELFFNNKMNIPRQDYEIFIENPSKKYFSRVFPDDYSFLLKKRRQSGISSYTPQEILPLYDEKKFLKESTEHFYLWERHSLFSPQNNEVIPYQIFVSQFGKPILSFPEKLSSNTQETIDMEEYINEASYFINNKFHWTKLEAVVQ